MIQNDSFFILAFKKPNLTRTAGLENLENTANVHGKLKDNNSLKLQQGKNCAPLESSPSDDDSNDEKLFKAIGGFFLL